jgi:hypothetical protein
MLRHQRERVLSCLPARLIINGDQKFFPMGQGAVRQHLVPKPVCSQRTRSKTAARGNLISSPRNSVKAEVDKVAHQQKGVLADAGARMD